MGLCPNRDVTYPDIFGGERPLVLIVEATIKFAIADVRGADFKDVWSGGECGQDVSRKLAAIHSDCTNSTGEMQPKAEDGR